MAFVSTMSNFLCRLSDITHLTPCLNFSVCRRRGAFQSWFNFSSTFVLSGYTFVNNCLKTPNICNNKLDSFSYFCNNCNSSNATFIRSFKLLVHYFITQQIHWTIFGGYYYYYRYSTLGQVWSETRAYSGDWYGSGTLHPLQVLRGSLPLLSPIGRYLNRNNLFGGTWIEIIFSHISNLRWTS